MVLTPTSSCDLNFNLKLEAQREIVFHLSYSLGPFLLLFPKCLHITLLIYFWAPEPTPFTLLIGLYLLKYLELAFLRLN